MFKDREEAGQKLALRLSSYAKGKNTLVLGLARGGVVVAHEIAKALKIPLNVLVPRKMGAPDNPELAIGAVAEDGEVLLNEEIVRHLGVSPAFIQEEIQRAKQLAHRRLAQYRRAAPLGSLEGKVVILVDDGVATGATLLVEIQHLRKQGVSRIVVATPVAAADAWSRIQAASDEAICLQVQEHLQGISEFYLHFMQVEDDLVITLLKRQSQ